MPLQISKVNFFNLLSPDNGPWTRLMARCERFKHKGVTLTMGIFGTRASNEPNIRIIKEGTGSRVLDFSEFMDQEMKKRIRSGVLDWMDKVNIFEGFYIPKRESEGWVSIKGGRNDGDRFKVSWQVGNDVIVGEYNDGESTVTERLKKAKK